MGNRNAADNVDVALKVGAGVWVVLMSGLAWSMLGPVMGPIAAVAMLAAAAAAMLMHTARH